MLERLPTEQAHPDSAEFDQLPTIQQLKIMNSADAQAASAVEPEIPRIAAAVEAIAGVLEKGGSLIYLGAGTSGRLGVLDAARSEERRVGKECRCRWARDSSRKNRGED